jgi:hypothetical protein
MWASLEHSALSWQEGREAVGTKKRFKPLYGDALGEGACENGGFLGFFQLMLIHLKLIALGLR